jgi:prepilin peptidase dependent protein B
MLRLSRQGGFTISELMVSMVIGLLILAGVVTVYISVLKSSNTVLKGGRLNGEMTAIMTIMANDIRRAGYWEAANFQLPTDNPFTKVFYAAGSQVNTSALRVHNNGGAGTGYVDVTYDVLTDGTGKVTAASQGSCIVYTYDAEPGKTMAGTVEVPANNEEFGFRWDGTAADPLLMRTSNNASGPNICAGGNGGNWEPITEVSEIIITRLNFDLSTSTCVNASEPDGVDDNGDGIDADPLLDPQEYDCYNVVPDALEHTVESRQVLITLSAQLADDPEVTYTLQQSVAVRNNLIRER